MSIPRALVLCLLTSVLFAAEAGTEATVAKKGNVRFGPNLGAGIAVTLPVGATVTILGQVQIGTETWYQIRFPKEGKAWMNQVVLKKLDDERYEVIEDKARVRDDATNGANIVAELSAGDVVEYKGQQVGNWLAVYPPKAVAYVHEIVLGAQQPAVVQQVQAQAQAKAVAADRAGLLWPVARDTFQRFAANKNLQAALQKDWAGLSAWLAVVAAEHQQVGARIDAGRLKDGVDAVVREQQKLGAQPAERLPSIDEAIAQVKARPAVVMPGPVGPAPVPVPEPGPAPVPAPVPAPAPAPTPGVNEPTIAAPSPEVASLMGDQAAKITASPGSFAAEGFLEQRGNEYVVYDTTSRVVAYLVPNGQNLSEYFWRKVGVKGPTQGTKQDASGIQVPVIVVEDVTMLSE